MLAYLIFSRDGHIISIAVDPKHRRRGIGKKLLERAIDAYHLRKLWAEVRKSNEGAQTFYLRMGFQIIGVVPSYYGNEDALIVQWTSPVQKPD
jgi:ribosomal protein S18 acetylase RimI-like enzyme